MNIQKELEIELFNGRWVMVNVTIEGAVENDGIGPYEYWGAKGNDKGTDYAVREGYSIDDAHYADNGTPALLDGYLQQLIEEEIERLDDQITDELNEEMSQQANSFDEDRYEDRHEDW